MMIVAHRHYAEDQRAAQLDEQAREACEREDWPNAISSCAAAIEELRHVFPAGSTMLAHEEAKLARLMFNGVVDAEQAKRADAMLGQAASALELCYGVDHDEPKELRHLQACLRR